MPMLHIVGKDMTDEETDAAAQAGSRIGMFRQCSIGWHEECSDPDGDECVCICHTEGGAETRRGRSAQEEGHQAGAGDDRGATPADRH